MQQKTQMCVAKMSVHTITGKNKRNDYIQIVSQFKKKTRKIWSTIIAVNYESLNKESHMLEQKQRDNCIKQ